MGNEMSYDAEHLISAIENNYNFIKVKEKAKKMNIIILVQGDASITMQNINDKASKTINLPGIKNPNEVNNLVQSISATMDNMAKDCGFVHYGFQ